MVETNRCYYKFPIGILCIEETDGYITAIRVVPIKPAGTPFRKQVWDALQSIPCHRVIGKDGSLVGFGGGLDMKRQLLELEKGNS